jgi:Trypsin-like peptidase domain
VDGLVKRQLVLVHTTLQKGAQLEHRYGTGYFVTSDLVLTASHVVPAWSKRVEVRIEGDAGPRQPQFRAAALPSVWRDEQLDTVLIRIDPPLPDVTLPRWPTVPLGENAEWTSVAYPKAVSEERPEGREWKTAGLAGTLYAHGGAGQGRRELDLGVKDWPGTTWSGASGAPIFVGSDLVGILTDELTSFEGRRIRGVGAELLLQNPGFLTAIAPPWLEPFPEKLWVLVLISENSRAELPRLLNAVVAEHRVALAEVSGRELEAQVKVVVITEALENPTRWLQFVRAMCVAPVMVVDVTGFQPGVMLALGVRSVVRRGVTVTTTASAVDESHLSMLPFDIQETKVVYHGPPGQEETDPQKQIGEAIRDGLLQLRTHPVYLDLPAYDGVRCPSPETVAGQPSLRDVVLLLCPFQERYANHWRVLRRNLRAEFPGRPIVRMIDITSPRLVGQALYEHIRWAACCVVDWTFWRQNVFFELGVRLASSEIGPLNLIVDGGEMESPPAAGEPASRWPRPAEESSSLTQHSQLSRLFRPIRYDLAGSSQPFGEASRYYKAISEGGAVTVSPGALGHDATYRMAVDFFDWQQESITRTPHQTLRQEVETRLGADPQQSGRSQVLYSPNPAFASELARGAREHWLAAWYYLRNRHPDRREDLLRLGDAVVQALRSSPDSDHQRIRGEIAAELAPLGELPSSRDLLQAVRDLKTRAKNLRDAGKYKDGVDVAKTAIDRLLSEELLPATKEWQGRLKTELADCYGLAGGIQRRWGLEAATAEERQLLLAKSAGAYDEGYKREVETKSAVSYNLVNRLVARVLYEPGALSRADAGPGHEYFEPLNVRTKLEEAERTIRDQLREQRRGDVWALADHALVTLLLGLQGGAAAYSDFQAAAPPDYAYESALATLRPLAQLDSPRTNELKDAVRRLESSLAQPKG